MPYFTYILESQMNGRYYVGSCENVTARLKRHNDGATPSTKSYRPWRVAWVEQHDSKTDALKPQLFFRIIAVSDSDQASQPIFFPKIGLD